MGVRTIELRLSGTRPLHLKCSTHFLRRSCSKNKSSFLKLLIVPIEPSTVRLRKRSFVATYLNRRETNRRFLCSACEVRMLMASKSSVGNPSNEAVIDAVYCGNAHCRNIEEISYRDVSDGG